MDTIVRAKNLGLSLNVDVHRPWNMRDIFADALSHPLQFLTRPKDRLVVLKNLNLEVKKGDRVGLLGINGAGKTSLCRCLSGMFRPTVGEVELHGTVRAIFDTRVGIQPELTGRENADLMVHLLFPGIKKAEAKSIVEEALAFSELERFVDVPFKMYSNGMQTRLCLSLISAKPADLLILDEVFDGADAYFQKKSAKRVRDLIDRSGAVIFVSHSSEQVLQICNRVIVIHHSEIIFDGSPNQGLDCYKNLHNRLNMPSTKP